MLLLARSGRLGRTPSALQRGAGRIHRCPGEHADAAGRHRLHAVLRIGRRASNTVRGSCARRARYCARWAWTCPKPSPAVSGILPPRPATWCCRYVPRDRGVERGGTCSATPLDSTPRGIQRCRFPAPVTRVCPSAFNWSGGISRRRTSTVRPMRSSRPLTGQTPRRPCEAAWLRQKGPCPARRGLHRHGFMKCGWPTSRRRALLAGLFRRDPARKWLVTSARNQIENSITDVFELPLTKFRREI